MVKTDEQWTCKVEMAHAPCDFQGFGEEKRATHAAWHERHRAENPARYAAESKPDPRDHWPVDHEEGE